MAKFFYTYYYPHRWTSGPVVVSYDLEKNQNIDSLERARELAIQKQVKSYGDDRCVTAYGQMFDIDDELESRNA